MFNNIMRLVSLTLYIVLLCYGIVLAYHHAYSQATYALVLALLNRDAFKDKQ
jgi:hypothetical protein